VLHFRKKLRTVPIANIGRPAASRRYAGAELGTLIGLVKSVAEQREAAAKNPRASGRNLGMNRAFQSRHSLVEAQMCPYSPITFARWFLAVAIVTLPSYTFAQIQSGVRSGSDQRRDVIRRTRPDNPVPNQSSC